MSNCTLFAPVKVVVVAITFGFVIICVLVVVAAAVLRLSLLPFNNQDINFFFIFVKFIAVKVRLHAS